jgi:hypothetical protein
MSPTSFNSTAQAKPSKSERVSNRIGRNPSQETYRHADFSKLAASIGREDG